MNFKQFYLNCLSHASYYIGSGAEAVVIDPQRDVDQYISEAESHNQTIKYIIETHSHADFVSGHIELAERTGAQIVFGARAQTSFDVRKVSEGDVIELGSLQFLFHETPGHTPEGITIVVKDSSDQSRPLKMFTGDTLFIGDVGRPDLIGSKGFTSEQMATMLYESLHQKILTYPDSTEVYPAHGAGSLCGKSLSKETWSTLGEQKISNYALRAESKEQFIELVSSDQMEVPMYFPASASKNLQGATPLNRLTAPIEFSAADLSSFEGIVIDVRTVAEFGAGHLPGSINIGLGGQFASWAGTVVPIGTPVVIFAVSKNQVDEAVMRLARIGIETVEGYLLHETMKISLKEIPQVPVASVAEIVMGVEGIQLVDVRRPAEYANGHAAGAVNLPLDRLSRDLTGLDKSKPTYVICQSGYRSSLASGILERAGFESVQNVTGGTQAWIAGELPVETTASACQASRN